MKVCGFTIARNVLKFDYPVKEAILSLLPVCDHFVVAVGKSEDDTLAYIQSIDSPKVQIIETEWDDSLREGGRVLAEETNKAFDAISEEFDWAFYIQGDEVLDDRYYDEITSKLSQYKDDRKVEGFLFNYRHFYGSYDYVATAKRWYKHEIRIIRNDKSIRSYKDAQGFRKNGKKLKVAPLDAYINHYGWVKHPKHQQEKQKHFNKLWHDDQWVAENVDNSDLYNYNKIDFIEPFQDEHPNVMKTRIKEKNWTFLPPKNPKVKMKVRVQHWLKKHLGLEFGVYRNYELLEGY